MKRLFKILIATLIMITSVIGLVACGDGDSDAGQNGVLFKKFKGDDFYTVYGYKGDSTITKLDIGSINSDTVTIGRIKVGAFEDNDTLLEIIVPETVKEIDAGAFQNMKKLEKITLPFVGANRNADAFIGETAKSSDKATDAKRTFGYIFGTEEYEAGSSITNKYGKESATYYIPTSLYEVTIKSSAEYKIPMYAFSGIAQIEVINIEGDIKTIGEYAFSDMTALRKVNLTTSLKQISKGAFNGCAKLSDSEMFNGLTLDLIGEEAFVGTALTTLKVSCKEIGESAFAGTNLVKFEISDAEKICAFAFYNCESLDLDTFSIEEFIGGLTFGSDECPISIISQSIPE